MSHPDVAAPSGLTTRQAFDEVHSHKGWVLAKPEAVAASDDDITETVAPEVPEAVAAETTTAKERNRRP